MLTSNLLTGLLGLILQYEQTQCNRLASRIATVLAALADDVTLDVQPRSWCEQASLRYFDLSVGERHD